MNKFLFDEFGRLRSGWRFGLFWVMFLFAATVLAAVAGPLLFLELPKGSAPTATIILNTAVGLTAAVVTGWACGRFLDNVPFKALGAAFTKGWFKDVCLGLAIGAAAVCLAVLASMSFGGLGFAFNAAAGWPAIARSAAISVVVFGFGAAFEETLVRGYMFQTFVRSNLAWVAIALTSLIFASGHIGNPDAGYFSFANTALAGVWLGAAYLKTRTLWLPFGLHFAWNFALGSVFGIEVSGLTNLASSPLLKEFDTGPVWLTGGRYGLEGGAACTIALIAAIALVWFAPVFKADHEMVKLSSPPTESEEI